MRKPGMSIHSIESFNESEEIRILSSVLESHHTIKTFFKEIDRTPNHDGFFELVSGDLSPKKQFIVQIKKVEDLKPNIIGPNKGRYVYPLETNFLYYVKEKVTESPAIYFVVDIATKRIFWLYLSDAVLMDLNFEGHEKVSYAFGEENILSDIDAFTAVLNDIAIERNRLFLRKTPEEIGEMQEAVEYINGLLEHDLSFVKKTLFPNLWRFGIKSSNTSELSIEVNGNKITPAVSSIIALYPQVKGVPDTGIREYYPEATDLLKNIVLGGKSKPIKYSKDTLHKIIKYFFEGRVPLECLPDIALEELVGGFVEESDRLFGVERPNSLIRVDDAERRFCYLANYISHILSSNAILSDSEKQIKEIIIRKLLSGERNNCRFAPLVSVSGGTQSFQKFCAENPDSPSVFNPNLFVSMDLNYIQVYCAFRELRARSITEFAPVWNYSDIPLRMLPIDEFDEEANKIIDQWFEKLPELYEYTYTKLFDTDKYRFLGKYIYRCNGQSHDYGALASVSSVLHVYSDSSFQILRDDGIEMIFSDTMRSLGIERTSVGRLFDDFLAGKTLYYDSICCLLYEGVCRELGYKPEKLRIQTSNSGIGLLLFD